MNNFVGSITAAVVIAGCLAFFADTSGLDDSPNEDKPSNEYLSKKDAKVIGIGLVIFIIVGIPVYVVFKSQVNAYLCKQNLQAMSISMSNYMLDYDDRLPPLFLEDANTGLPALDEHGMPYTWASTLTNISGFDSKRSFMCPSASNDQAVKVEGLNGEPMYQSYGMYAAVAGKSRTDFANAGSIVMISETDNGGSDGTYDPAPMKPEGKLLDGFVIGYSTGNLIPKDGNLPMIGSGLSKHVGITRLAFSNTQNGVTDNSVSPRHGGKILALFLDGHYQFMNAKEAEGSSFWQLPSD